MNKLVIATTLAAVLASGCSSPSSSVPWGDYDPSVKQSIDALATAKDCAGLQSQFDTADANNTVTMNRTGHNNAKLMSYINDKMKAAGC